MQLQRTNGLWFEAEFDLCPAVSRWPEIFNTSDCQLPLVFSSWRTLLSTRNWQKKEAGAGETTTGGFHEAAEDGRGEESERARIEIYVLLLQRQKLKAQTERFHRNLSSWAVQTPTMPRSHSARTMRRHQDNAHLLKRAQVALWFLTWMFAEACVWTGGVCARYLISNDETV